MVDSPTLHINLCRKVLIIDAPPRTGKDHAVIEYLIRSGRQWVGITVSHRIVEHQLDLIRKICTESGLPLPEVIHLEGKQRCCRNPSYLKDCRACPLYPQDYSKMRRHELEIERLLTLRHIVTCDDIGSCCCPFYALCFGLDKATCILTVKELFPLLPSDDRTLFIDEEEAIDFFRAKSIAVLQLTRRKGYVSSLVLPLNERLKSLQLLRIIIAKRSTTDQADNVILAGITALEETDQRILDRIGHVHEDAFLDELVRSIQEVPLPAVEDHETVIKRLREYATTDDLREVIKFIEPVICFDRFYKQTHQGSNVARFYLIADEFRFFYLDQLRAFEHIVVVGKKEAREFARQIGDFETIEISDFKYAKNYLVFCADRPLELILANLKVGVPQLVLCGSKERAFNLYELIGRRRVVALKTDTRADIMDYWRINNTVIFYNNSAISKGIDLPQFDVLVVSDYNFSSPYYEAVRTEEELREKIIRETLQSALRITPTPDDDELQPKVVIFPRRVISIELPYIDDQLVEIADPAQIAQITSALCRRGKVVVP